MKSIFTENRTALITGASAGIGFEITKSLATKLDALIVIARRAERLKQLANELQAHLPKLKVVVEAADLSDPEGVEDLLKRLDEHRLAVDVLVNNAGLGEAELFERSPWSRIQQIIAVNVLARLRLSHHLLPPMISRGHGAILNIGSGAGYAAMPNAAVYTVVEAHSASSFALGIARCTAKRKQGNRWGGQLSCEKMQSGRRRSCNGGRQHEQGR